MPVCALPNSQGFLAVTDKPLNECHGGYVAVTIQDYDYLMSYTRITPTDAGLAFSFGFMAVFALGYLSTYAVYVGKKLINLL
ncbi:single-stranded DNA-binding protein [Vibrio cholerae]|nr:single-stranded DNA-binding protein [Vibrio cholerae]EGQ9334088.1 single-stranded DNA-binding protein [Vibrio cholerae]EIA3093184.1 single-stranded DNA-binding protein [Vibrio cholerae]EJL6321962.1 single-stranded DNA-binding protein [Vibrio cholerae]EJL7023772.1 single-stranded DNA-binding protein [Vibrio cholerae]